MQGIGTKYRIIKAISIAVLALFLVNLVSVIPSAMHHPKEHGVTHQILSDAVDLAKSAEKQRHDHIENCGMISCAVAISRYEPNIAEIRVVQMQYDATGDALISFDRVPPGRPPLS